MPSAMMIARVDGYAAYPDPHVAPVPIEPPTKEESKPSKRRSKRARAASATNTHDPLTTAN